VIATLPTSVFRRSVAQCMRILALLALVVVLPGCCGCCGASVVPDPIGKAVAALSAAAAMAGRMAKAGKLFAHYAERRITYLTGKNPGWLTESNYASLTARIGAELDQVAAFVDERTTTLLGTDPKSPGHRDLADAAFQLTSFGPTTISTWLSKYKQGRRDRIAEIAYRACAVQPELWSGGDATLAPTLQPDPLTEVLDRRLGAVEMLLLHDDTLLYDEHDNSLRVWKLAGRNSGWADGGRVTMFEYAWVDLDTDNFRAAMASAAPPLTVPGLAPEWSEDKFENRIKWSDRLNRPRPAAAADWTVFGTLTDPPGSPYYMELVGGPASAVFERLVPIAPKAPATSTDFYDRNWLYCDMTLAALHLHGLRLGRARRTGSDAAFDAIVTQARLLPLIPKAGAPVPEYLIPSGSTWFDGTGVLREELQVGDHVVYWNNPFVRYMLSSAFGLENSYVTHIDQDGHSVMLAGHGMRETTEGRFSEIMAGEMARNFEKLRAEISRRHGVGNDDPAFLFTLNTFPIQILRWAPFGETFTPSLDSAMTAPGAWWVRMARTILRDANDPVPTMDQALGYAPKSVQYDSTKHTQKPASFTDDTPDFQAAVYVPLMKPAVKGGWDAYFKNPQPGGNVQLDDLVPDGEMIPGFFAQGPATKIPVLRPKLTA
jgi:hypothetical protein